MFDRPEPAPAPEPPTSPAHPTPAPRGDELTREEITEPSGGLDRLNRIEVSRVQIDERLIKMGSLAPYVGHLKNRILHYFTLNRQVPALHIGYL